MLRNAMKMDLHQSATPLQWIIHEQANKFLEYRPYESAIHIRNL